MSKENPFDNMPKRSEGQVQGPQQIEESMVQGVMKARGWTREQAENFVRKSMRQGVKEDTRGL